MAYERIILEMGSGNDLYGEDYTKAACRAVQNALHHSTLTLFRSLKIDPTSMKVLVTVAVQEPDKINKEAVTAQFPHGQITVKPVFGGQVVDDPINKTRSVVATVAIEAMLEDLGEKWKLKP